MRNWVTCCVMWLLAVGCLASTTDARSDVFGLWASKGTIFSIGEQDGELVAKIVAMTKPRLDKKNPSPELRERPVLGLQVLSDYRFKRGQWRGRIYDPGSGRTFKSYMKLDSEGNLRVRGYVGLSMFGKTQTFEPASNCTARIIAMLGSAELDHVC